MSKERSAIPAPAAGEDFIASLTETDLYSVGAFFCDRHPDLVEELLERAAEIETAGLSTYAQEGDLVVAEAFQTLLTGLAVRYYKAVAS